MIDGKFEFKRVRRRFRHPLRTGLGSVEAVERILLRSHSQRGVGYGEVAPWPGFPTETTEMALEVLRSAQGRLSHLAAVVDASPQLPCLAAALSSCRHWEAIAAFGGSLPCAGLTSHDGSDVGQKKAEGFRTLKVKILPTTALADVRNLLVGFDGTLRLDANASLDLAAARAWLEFVRSEPRIEFLEQPLSVGHAGYASLGTAKVALDESFLTPAGLSWDGPVVVKPLLVGDWDRFRAWRQAEPSRRVVYSSCFETAIGRQGALWLAAQDRAPAAVGFDTLGRFERDGRDRHLSGPSAHAVPDLNWEQFWQELT
jgi:O-succinylbenzoate synthase